jgi:hypothetical protein
MNMGKTKSALLAAALLGTSMAANSQTVEFEFTGFVTGSNVSSAADGAAITGIYSFNLSNADLSSDGLSYGSISNTTNWLRGVEGQASVFSSTATSGGFSFSDSLATGFTTSSQIAAGNGAPPPDGFFYSASKTQFTSRSSFTESQFSLLASGAPFTLNGLPAFDTKDLGTGDIQYSSGQQVSYTITSLKAVVAPEISADSAAAGLALLAGGMLVLGSRRRSMSRRG